MTTDAADGATHEESPGGGRERSEEAAPRVTPGAAPVVVVFDLETTGTDTSADEIVELSAQVGLGDGAEIWTCRMRPSRPIPAAASAVHGIRDADVGACEAFPAHAARIRQLLTGADVLVGYNLTFDLSILDAELERHGLPPLDLSRTLVVDAYALWRSVEPRTLAGAHARFVGAPLEGAHRAAVDVSATDRVLRAMLAHFGLDGAAWETVAERAQPGRRRWIGPTHHLEWRAGVPVVTFGKHRGRAIDAVAANDPAYLRIVIDGRFPAHVKRVARLALELDARSLRRRLAATHGAPAPPDGPAPEPDAPPPDTPTPAGSMPAGEEPADETPASDAPAPPHSSPAGTGGPVILFDGVCNLCEGWVKFVLAHDGRGRFVFASLESEVAGRLLARHPATRGTDSIVLLEGGRVHIKSAAALRILRGLGGAWSLVYAFWIVPKPVRDLVYDLVARNRYRWFGRKESCMLPAPEVRARFIDQE